MPQMENLSVTDSHIAQVMSGLAELAELTDNVEIEIEFRESAIQILRTAIRGGLIGLAEYGHIIEACERMNEEARKTL